MSSQQSDEPRDVVPADIRSQVMPAVLDELARWASSGSASRPWPSATISKRR